MKSILVIASSLVMFGAVQAQANFSCTSDDLYPWELAPNNGQGLVSGKVDLLDSKGHFKSYEYTNIEVVSENGNKYVIKFVDEPSFDAAETFNVTCEDDGYTN